MRPDGVERAIGVALLVLALAVPAVVSILAIVIFWRR